MTSNGSILFDRILEVRIPDFNILQACVDFGDNILKEISTEKIAEGETWPVTPMDDFSEFQRLLTDHEYVVEVNNDEEWRKRTLARVQSYDYLCKTGIFEGVFQKVVRDFSNNSELEDLLLASSFSTTPQTTDLPIEEIPNEIKSVMDKSDDLVDPNVHLRNLRGEIPIYLKVDESEGTTRLYVSSGPDNLYDYFYSGPSLKSINENGNLGFGVAEDRLISLAWEVSNILFQNMFAYVNSHSCESFSSNLQSSRLEEDLNLVKIRLLEGERGFCFYVPDTPYSREFPLNSKQIDAIRNCEDPF